MRYLKLPLVLSRMASIDLRQSRELFLILLLALSITAGAFSVSGCSVLQDPGFIAYTSGPEGNRNIEVIRPDGSQRTAIIAHPADDFSPRWSPDHKLIAFLSNRDGNTELYVSPADGSTVMRTTNTSVAESQPIWSPEAKSLAFVSPDSLDRPHIYIMEISDLAPRRLSFGTIGEKDPSWSPDGKWIAFAAIDEDSNSIGIFLRNPIGVNRIHLTHGPDSQPSWSPDSDKLAFVSERDGNQEIYVVDISGNSFPEPLRLTDNPANDFAPLWSPNGERIAFLSTRSGHISIYAVSPEGDHLGALTQNEVDERSFVWGPSGEIAFISELTDNPALFVMDGNGENQQVVLSGELDYTLPDW